MKRKIPLRQKLFSCTVYFFNFFFVFFSWITINGKQYNVFQSVAEMEKQGIDAFVSDAEYLVISKEALAAGVWIEAVLFFLFLVFGVLYLVLLILGRRSFLNVLALADAFIICMWNAAFYIFPSFDTSSTIMLCFPVVFLILCGIEFFAGKAMEQWEQMTREAKEIQERDRAQRKEEKERLAFAGKYSPLFYRFLWKNSRKTWRDYMLLLACSSLIFSFIVVCFGMYRLLKEENNIEGVVQAIGSLSSILISAMLPMAIVSIIIVIILSFYYLKCRARNYGIFITLGMRKKTLAYFIALEFLSVLILTLLIGGSFGTLFLYLFVRKSGSFLGVQLAISQVGILTYILSVLTILAFYLIAFMAARDLFVSFRLGNSTDLQMIKEKMPFRGRKVFLIIGVFLILYSWFEYGQLRNFEKSSLLLIFFLGLYLTLRYGIAQYLRRERQHGRYLQKLLLHNQLFHRSKTNTAYITAMTILLFCALFYFPLQFLSVQIAEDEDVLYPYDIVCMANENDNDIFKKLQKEYQITLESYPMVRVANLDATERKEGRAERIPQGQQIGISESTYQALKKEQNPQWVEEDLGLDPKGESIYIVHQQDKSIKAQPVDFWLSRKEPALHIGIPTGETDRYRIKQGDTGFAFKQIKGEEIGSLTGVFGQGKWDNLIVFSDEYFEVAKELWKTTDPVTGKILSEEQMESLKGNEDYFVQGPSKLVLIRAKEKEIGEIEEVLQEFRMRHKEDESYDPSVQSCYLKDNAVLKLRTERIMKTTLNVMMFGVFVAVYFVLLIVKILMERQVIRKRTEFLRCMGMKKKDRKHLIFREVYYYYYLLPAVTAISGTLIFTGLVFYARQYRMEDMKAYLGYAVPLWGVTLVIAGVVTGAALKRYAYVVEERK